MFCFDRFLPLYAFASWSLSLWVLLITELLREVATVAYVLICVVLELKLNQKWIYYFAYTNVANENCVKFCMKQVFKCRERRMMRWDEVWTKAQAWGCPCHTNKISKRYKRQSLGMPQGTLFFINKNIRSSFKTLYFYCFICYVFFLERLYFFFQFCLLQ
jgi:hypothetical protein